MENKYITLEEIEDRFSAELTFLDKLKLQTFRKIIHVSRVKETSDDLP